MKQEFKRKNVITLTLFISVLAFLFFDLRSPWIVNSMPSPIATSSSLWFLIPFLMRPSTRMSSGPNSSSLSPCSVDIQPHIPLPISSFSQQCFFFVRLIGFVVYLIFVRFSKRHSIHCTLFRNLKKSDIDT